MALKAARKKSGKTQAQVAKESGITEQAYQRYEYDKREPGVRTAIRIAKAVGSTVENLFTDTSVAQNEQMCNTEDVEGDESDAKS